MDDMNKNEDIIYTVARMYYQDNMNQSEISDSLELSKSKVSRLLTKAKEDGIVRIQIKSPGESNIQELSFRIKEKFGIPDVIISDSPYEDPSMNLNYTISKIAPYFQSFLRDKDKMGVSWGYTLLKLAGEIQSVPLLDSSIHQITGNLDNADATNFAHEIVRRFASKLDITQLKTLPCPVIVENPIIVDLLLHDSKISKVMEEVNNIDIAFPNIGTLTSNNCLCLSGYVSVGQLHDMQRKGAVGCICCHFIDKDGKIIDLDFEARTISIQLESLKNARHSFMCVTNEEKIPALIGCLKAGYINVLALDLLTAEKLLYFADK
ncbi:MAG: sugar-binding domain-containing protein [Hespellia sp.]|nr:sugar-binding domain-containing protein [Hespellia sp.]